MSESKKPAVAVVGSLNIDYFTRVENLPAPGETVASDQLNLFKGGKGANQAVSARRQGCRVLLFGAVGEDESGESYKEALAEEGIDVSHVATVSGSTGTAFIVVDRRGENMIVTAAGANQSLTREDIRKGLTRIEACDALLGQFEVPLSSLVEAARIANRKQIPVILNPSPFNPTFPWQEVRTDYLIVNEREAEELLEFAPLSEEVATVRGRMHELRIDHLIVTRAEDDTLVYRRTGEPFEVPTLPVLPIDTVGAGDAFAGCFAARIASGESLDVALRAANCAGALATLGAGAQNPMPDRAKVDRHLEHLAQGA
ncbi:MAG: ribokinase [Verrucomicrobiales bacterium]